MNKSEFLPLLPLRDIVVFPSMVAPLFVGRDKSIKALNEVMNTNKKIVLVTQKNSEIDDPSKDDIFEYGCEGKILQLLKLPDGTVKVLIEGVDRIKIIEFKDNKDGYMDLVINEILPIVAEENLADYVDIFCEKGYFSVEDTKYNIGS